MEVDVVHQQAIVVVFQPHFDGVSDPYADEGARNLVTEGPVAIGRSVGELADDLNRFQINLDPLRATLADGWRQISRIAHNRNRAVRLHDLADDMRVRDWTTGRLSAE